MSAWIYSDTAQRRVRGNGRRRVNLLSPPVFSKAGKPQRHAPKMAPEPIGSCKSASPRQRLVQNKGRQRGGKANIFSPVESFKFGSKSGRQVLIGSDSMQTGAPIPDCRRASGNAPVKALPAFSLYKLSCMEGFVTFPEKTGGGREKAKSPRTET